MPRQALVIAAALALAGALFALASPALADWPTDPTVGVLVSGTTANENSVQVATDAAGGMFVAWSDNRSVVERTRLQRVGATGVQLWPQAGVTVASLVVQQDMPRILPDGAGGVLVAWRDRRESPWSRVYAQRFHPNGVPMWEPGGVLIGADTLDMEPVSLVPDGEGGALVAMLGRNSASPFFPGLSVQRISALGTLPWGGPPITLRAVATAGFYQPMFSPDGAGGGLLAWQEFDGTRYDVVAQLVTANGSRPWGIGGARVGPSGTARFSPSIVTDAAGGAIVEWHDMGQFHVMAQRLDPSGVRMWDSLGVVLWRSTETAGDTLVADGAGGAYALHGRFQTAVRHLSPDGTLDWGGDSLVVTRVGTRTSDIAFGLSTPVAPDGWGLLLAWSEPVTSIVFTPQQIRTQKVTRSGALAWGDSGVVTSIGSGQRNFPALVSDGGGGVLAVWRDARVSNDFDLYAQRVAFDGTFRNTGAPVPIGPTLALSAPAPNPARTGSGVTLHARLDLREPVRVAVHDVSGRVVRVLFDGSFRYTMEPTSPVREHTFRWDGLGPRGERAAPGLYFVHVRNGARTATARVAIVE